MTTTRALLSRGLLGALAVMALLAAVTCGYDPNPESGTLQCGSSNTCPQNYTCRSGRCYRDGGGGSGGTGGSGGSTGGGGIDGFLGAWSFNGAASKRVRQCNDGTNETLMPWNDSFYIGAGVGAPLIVGYYCDWNLNLNGNTTAIRSGQMCSMPDVNDATTIFTWRGESFNLTTTDGVTGTLEASLPYDYVTTSGTGACTMKFTGTVIKN